VCSPGADRASIQCCGRFFRIVGAAPLLLWSLRRHSPAWRARNGM
jgi:hypothetical protein